MQKLFLEIVCLSSKFDLRLKKKVWGNFSITRKKLVLAIKKASHTIFIYGNCMRAIFFQKKET